MEDLRPRSGRRHRVLVAMPFVLAVVMLVSLVATTAGDRKSEVDWLAMAGVIAFTTVGALIEDRRPGQVVGRICLAMGVLLVAASLVVVGAVALDSLPGRIPPLGAALAVIGSAMFGLVLFLSGPLIVSRFPDGRTPGRLAVLVDGLLAVSVAVLLSGVLRPGPIEAVGIERVDNPLAFPGIPSVGSDEAFLVGFVAYGLASILASIGLVRRYVRGSPVVRAQIRWLGAAIGTSIMFFVLLLVTSGDEALNGAAWSAWLLSLLLPPLAIGVAILRYRLYDIDRIVSNAIGYGLVTVVLFGIFATANLALVSNVSPLVNNEGIAVAASTLLVAALFNPVRLRVQRTVDRRFHRARYDAEMLVSEFVARLRDEVDLPTLAADLDAIVRRSISPSSVELWLRRPSR